MDGNKAVGKALRILEVITNHAEGITLSGIVAETKLPKSTVFDILEALYSADAIFYKDFYRKSYVIGAKLYAIGNAYMKHSNFINISKNLLDAFANNYKLIAYACKRIDNRVVYVYNTNAEGCKLNPHEIGSSYRLYNSIAGKVFLAYASDEEQAAYLSGIQDDAQKKKLKDDLDSIKSRGYLSARDNEFKAIYKCAVPVFNFEDKVVGAIVYTQLRDSSVGLDKQIFDFINIAKEISLKQGYKCIK